MAVVIAMVDAVAVVVAMFLVLAMVVATRTDVGLGTIARKPGATDDGDSCNSLHEERRGRKDERERDKGKRADTTEERAQARRHEDKRNEVGTNENARWRRGYN